MSGKWRAGVSRRRQDAAERLLLRSGRVPARLTPAPVLAEFLSRLHPITSEHQLIRMGAEHDGGYLLPDDLDGIEVLLSPGVGTISKFELECAERGMDVYMADGSVDGPVGMHPRFRFIRSFVGAVNDEHSITMDRGVRSEMPRSTGDILLQMDIEDAEYAALVSMSHRLLARCRIIAVEMHGLDRLFLQHGFDLMRPTFEKLLHQHACVHIHPNNWEPLVTHQGITLPRVAEFTFHRRERLHQTGFARTFPHPLDRDNRRGHPPVHLPASLHRSDR